jgi:hypothetical protein
MVPGMGLDAKCSVLNSDKSVRPEWGNSHGDGWDKLGDELVCCVPLGLGSMF